MVWQLFNFFLIDQLLLVILTHFSEPIDILAPLFVILIYVKAYFNHRAIEWLCLQPTLNLLVKLIKKLVVWINIFFREQKTTKQRELCLLEVRCFHLLSPSALNTFCKFPVSLMLVPWVDCLMSFWWVTFCVLFWQCQWLLAGAMTTKVRRHDKRIHPYQRVVTPDRG